jgi:AcrR family transcriptional regulator
MTEDRTAGGSAAGGTAPAGSAFGGSYGRAAVGEGAPRDRPLRADARRNRARVLEAARAAFAAEGASVPLDEIARRAGVGAGTVYRHFPTKQALFEAVVDDRLRQLTEDGRALRAADVDPGDALFRFIGRLVTEAAPKRDLIDALNSSGVDVTPALRGAVDELRAETGRLLARAQRARAVRADIGLTDLTALLSGTIQATQRPPGQAIDPQRAIAVLCDGLRAPLVRD